MMEPRFLVLITLVLWFQRLSGVLATPVAIASPPDPVRVEDKEITVSLFNRPEYRTLAEASADKDLKFFHWTIDVSQAGTEGQLVDSFDASDHTQIRKGPKEAVEPNLPKNGNKPEFKFQYKYGVKPANALELRARVKIASTKSSTEQVKDMLQDLPTPCKDGESCVSWAQSAIRRLQEKGIVRQFDVDAFSKTTLEYGFERFSQFNAMLDPKLPIEWARQDQMAIAELGENDAVKRPAAPDRAKAKAILGIEGEPKQGSPKEGTKPGTPDVAGPPKPASRAQVKPTSEEFVKLSDDISAKEFESFLTRFRVANIGQQSEDFSPASMREKLKTSSKLPFKDAGARVEAGAVGAAAVGAGAAAVAVPLYIDSVIKVFSQDTTTMQKAAVITSVVPFAGCAAEALATNEAGSFNGAQLGLCVLGDGLLCGPLMPLGLATHVVRATLFAENPAENLIRYFNSNTQLADRDRTWAAHIGAKRDYIRSSNFTSAIETQIKLETAAVAFAAAQAKGYLGAAEALSQPNDASSDKPVATEGAREGQDKIESQLCAAYASKMKDIQGGYAKAMSKALSDQAFGFNNNFLEQYINTSFEITPKEKRPYFRPAMLQVTRALANMASLRKEVDGLMVEVKSVVDTTVSKWVETASCSKPVPTEDLGKKASKL